MTADSAQHIVYLYPKATFRTRLRSDTLWGLMCWGISLLYGEKGENGLETFIEACQNGHPRFILSSAFPFQEKKEEKKLFFPRPFLPIERLEDDGKRKDLKKIKYLDKASVDMLVKGKLNEASLRDHLLDKMDDFKETIIDSTSVTHNTIDRQKGGGTYKDLTSNRAGQLYHTEDSYVSINLEQQELELIRQGEKEIPKAGLFFLVKGDLDYLKPVLRLFEHIGLGGDRSIGKGFFEFEWEEFQLPETSKINGELLLSLAAPMQEELEILDKTESPLLNYKITRRQGKVGMLLYFEGVEKKPVLMFEEGSVFPVENSSQTGFLKGCIKEVVEKRNNIEGNFPIYHSGLAYTLPIYFPIP